MPKFAGLLTDWLTVGTSGPTIDGRVIKPEWLKDCAETYDPDDYTAVVNAEHWFGNFGTVRELRTVEDKKGRTALQARIRPNSSYLMQNSEDRRLFFSMELGHDFAKSGKTYLIGLATTDNPASLGTSETHFTSKDNENLFRGGSEEFSIASLKPAEEQKESLITAFMDAIKEYFTTNNPKPQNEDFSMTEAQFNEFKQGQKDLAAAVTNLCTILTPKKDDDKDKKPEKENLTDKDKKPEKTSETEKADFTEFNKSIATLNDSVAALTKKFDDAMNGKFGKDIPKNTGGETEKGFI